MRYRGNTLNDKGKWYYTGEYNKCMVYELPAVERNLLGHSDLAMAA